MEELNKYLSNLSEHHDMSVRNLESLPAMIADAGPQAANRARVGLLFARYGSLLVSSESSGAGLHVELDLGRSVVGSSRVDHQVSL